MTAIVNGIADQNYSVPTGPQGFTHYLKVWPKEFRQVWCGEKTAEFRLNDRDFKRGDILVLEWFQDTREFSRRSVTVEISCITTGFGIPDGYAMLSFFMTGFCV